MAIMSKNRTMFKLSYYVFGFENKYCCLFLINKGTLLYDQPSYFTWDYMQDDKFYILWLHYQKWIIQILNEWMNELRQPTYALLTFQLPLLLFLLTEPQTSDILNVTAHLKAILHTIYSCILMIIYIPNFTYLAPVVYWISDWQFAKEFHTSATLLLHIIRERLPLQNFHIFWRFIIIHPPLQFSN